MFQGNTIKLLWTYADKDPIYGNLKWHGTFSGVRSIHLLTPLWKKPNAAHNRDIRQWDVTVKNVSKTKLLFQSYLKVTFASKCKNFTKKPMNAYIFHK